MKPSPLPWLASALSMTAGLYLLAGPFQTERAGMGRLLAPWIALTVYEFVVIGMIAMLRQRSLDAAALAVVSLFFLCDPIFLGDAFASTHLHLSGWTNGAEVVLGLLKAWALSRALGFPLTPWLAGWVAAAIGLIHAIPTLIAMAATRPALYAYLPQALTWGVAAVAVPLARSRWPGRVAIGALAVHFVASGLVDQLDFNLELLAAPQVALACILPWPRFGWLPLPTALYCSPVRPRFASTFSSLESMGWGFVAVAFVFLGFGFWRSLNVSGPQAAFKALRSRASRSTHSAG